MAHLVQIEPLKARNWKTICLFLVQRARWSERSMPRGAGRRCLPAIQRPFVSGMFEEPRHGSLGTRGDMGQ